MTDAILVNARIYAGDLATPRRRPPAEAAAIRDGRFVAAGRRDDVGRPRGATVIDAGGRTVMPGFVDAHAHLLGTGAAMRAVDLKSAASADEAVRRVAERVRTTPAGGWVRGAGWDQNGWPGQRFPHRRQLDAVAPEHPVVLVHTSGHCSWVNSAALRAAGVTAVTQAPPGGAIDRDDDGEPAGILRDNAMRLVTDVAPNPTQTERISALEDAIALAHRLGVTGVHAMDAGRGELQALYALHDAGRLPLRVRPFLSATRLDEWIGRNLVTGDGDDTLRIGGVKFYADGALGSLTAWMSEPYEGSDAAGFPLQPPEELEAQVRRCVEHGLATAVHAIGDRANHAVLDIYERLRHVAPALPRRIEHAQVLRPDDIAPFAPLGVAASMQPVHATQDMHKVDRWWRARGRTAYAFRSLLAAGASLAFGSDSPVETMDPLAGVHAAVTRRNAAGEPPGGWYPDERITLGQALDLYTRGPARILREDDVSGRIAAGCFADFVVLSRDPFELADPMQLLDVRVEMTAVAGNVVYPRDAS